MGQGGAGLMGYERLCKGTSKSIEERRRKNDWSRLPAVFANEQRMHVKKAKLLQGQESGERGARRGTEEGEGHAFLDTYMGSLPLSKVE